MTRSKFEFPADILYHFTYVSLFLATDPELAADATALLKKIVKWTSGLVDNFSNVDANTLAQLG